MTRAHGLSMSLEDVLKSLDYEDLKVEVEEGPARRLVAVVTTPAFQGLDEAERQSAVWGHVYDELDEDEQARIEFIFTNTPTEEEEMRKEDQSS